VLLLFGIVTPDLWSLSITFCAHNIFFPVGCDVVLFDIDVDVGELEQRSPSIFRQIRVGPQSVRDEVVDLLTRGICCRALELECAPIRICVVASGWIGCVRRVVG
jgi:hypothetical protein